MHAMIVQPAEAVEHTTRAPTPKPSTVERAYCVQCMKIIGVVRFLQVYMF
jgi:hypothetical protein